MLHNELQKYLQSIETAVESVQNVYVEKYVEEILTDERVNLRIRLRFISGYLLEMHEAVICQNDQIGHLDYRYHFQNSSNQLILRYDSTPHFPNLSTFPDHKHFYDQVIASTKPTIQNVIQEVIILLNQMDSL